MNTITNIGVRTIIIALAALLSIALFVAIAPNAQASDYFDTDWTDTGYQDTWAPSYDGTGYDTGWTDIGYQDTWSPSYYDTGYGGGSYGGGSYGGGGWSFGGGSGGSSGRSSSYSTSWSQTNTCTAVNSCNTYWDDHSIFNAPTTIVTNNTTPNYPVYQPSYNQPAPVYTQPVYQPAQRPIAYNNTPYVTLAAVPYTGLELGFWGTIAYWGFLVLWCLIAAYLIVVKKIQNKIATWFTGNTTQNSAVQKSSDLPSSGALQATPAGQTFVRQNSAPLFVGIDSFVLSQINRAK